MSQRQAIRMTPDEVDVFLAAGFRARIATVDRHGSPHVVPITYVLLDGCVAFWAELGSQKIVNLQHDPRVACIIDEGADFPELKGVEILGSAELRDDPDSAARIADAFLTKVPVEWHDMARAQLAELATERVVVAIKPARVNSWDHTKVPGLRPQDVGR